MEKFQFYLYFFLLSIQLSTIHFAKLGTENQSKDEFELIDEIAQSPQSSSFSNSNISYLLIASKNATWGYDIFVDNKLMIHQPNIPGMTGNNGFASKSKAESVAKLVVIKMKKGEMPPTVTLDEMRKVKAI